MILTFPVQTESQYRISIMEYSKGERKSGQRCDPDTSLWIYTLKSLYIIIENTEREIASEKSG